MKSSGSFRSFQQLTNSKPDIERYEYEYPSIPRGNGESKKGLHLDDLGRRLKEAQTLIDEHKEKYEKDRPAERKRAEERK